MATLTDAYVQDVIRRDVGGSGWLVSAPVGSMGTTRLVRRGATTVAIKLVDTPLDVLARLSDIGVAPPMIAAGEHEGRHYTIHQVITGAHPDHDWFAAHVGRWAELVRTYVADRPLFHKAVARRPWVRPQH